MYLLDIICRVSANGVFFDKHLQYSTCTMFLVYILVSIRTFQYLPALPNMSHIPSQINDAAAYSLLHIQDFEKWTPFPYSIDPSTYAPLPHPATEVSLELSDEISTLVVPPLWDPKEFKPYGNIRTYLGNYGRYLMTPEQAQTIVSYITIPSEDGTEFTDLKMIFVAIASYRDFQCRQTMDHGGVPEVPKKGTTKRKLHDNDRLS